MNKTKHYITADQEKALRRVGSNDFIEIDGNRLRGSAITEVMRIEDYNLQNPIKYSGEHTHYTFNGYIPVKRRPLTKEERINAIKSMIKGFTEHFSGREMKKSQEEILERMNNALEETDSSDKKTFDNPALEFLNM
ncbi:hypothetical protein [Syntrophus aciditrophicus]|nr:hypothetical protein [Syntrophus aciditrophicus]